MEGERPADLREARLSKLKALRAASVEPFADSFDRTHSVAEALALFAAAEAPGVEAARTEPVRLAGRIVRHRSQGKAAFADVLTRAGSSSFTATTTARAPIPWSSSTNSTSATSSARQGRSSAPGGAR